MRILIHSNGPHAATGYGQQVKLFAPRLRDLGHDVAISAFYGAEGTVLSYDGIPVLPKFSHPYGMDIVGAHAQKQNADIILTLIDGWVMDPNVLNAHAKWVPWFPVDHDPMPPAVVRQVQHAYQPIVFSRHAEQSARDAGLDVRYVPHGIDTTVMRPLPQRESRERLGIDPDVFLVSCVMANKGLPSRKAWPEQIEAFSAFRKRHPDAVLYLHTLMTTEMGGVNLAECLQHFGVPESAYLVADQYHQAVGGVPDDVMATIYSASDVLLNCTRGEGFGVPIVEAQACGCPVITGGWTAMAELTWAGWPVPVESARREYSAQAAFWYVPSPGAIGLALESAYDARGDQDLRDQASAGAQAYDADHVTDKYWRPVLAEIEERIAGESTPADLPAPEVLREAA